MKGPHEHYFFDQFAIGGYVVVCATCEEHIGIVSRIDDDSYIPLANAHWDEKVVHVGRVAGLRYVRGREEGR